MTKSKTVIQRPKKVMLGTIVSDKMDKTAVARVERTTQHPLYKKTLKRSKKYKLHDEKNDCRIGDQVRLIECKPISKDKNWRLLEIVRKAI